MVYQFCPFCIREQRYNEFIELCQHVECMVEKSMEEMSGWRSQSLPRSLNPLRDDMCVRNVRDANRSPSPVRNQDIKSDRLSQGHYAWRRPDEERKYRSQFLPMKVHDLVRDDYAVRRLLKATRASDWQRRDKSPDHSKVVLVSSLPPLPPQHRPTTSRRSRPANRLVVRHHSQ